MPHAGSWICADRSSGDCHSKDKDECGESGASWGICRPLGSMAPSEAPIPSRWLSRSGGLPAC